MKVALDTLGCKLNQAETECLARQLSEAGYRLVSPADTADIYILNTCTVTHTADAKSRRWLRQAHLRHPEALVVATGCYAQRAPRELAGIRGVGLVAGNDEKGRLLGLLSLHGGAGSPANAGEKAPVGRHPLPRTRAFVKIQDGCDLFCAYCIVPRVRGQPKSLPAAQVITGVSERASDGYQEVVLTGTNIGWYRHRGLNLSELLASILAETRIKRLRLSSLQPREITPELIGLWQDRRLCPHFHLALQSGSDGTLRRMKRGYSLDDYREAVSLIREMVPDAAITTDVMVGFPGETDEEFAQSYEFCRQMGFARIHVFSYSPRPGTAATRLPRQVNAPLKKRRNRQMLALAAQSARNFKRHYLGRTMPVLWEQPADGVWCGLSDNYIKVYTSSDDDLSNKLLPVKLEKIRGDGVWGIRQES